MANIEQVCSHGPSATMYARSGAVLHGLEHQSARSRAADLHMRSAPSFQTAQFPRAAVSVLT
jgi:hypothetical protein